MIALDAALDQRDRWLPPGAGEVPLDLVGGRGWHALTDLLFPVLVLKERALAHNLDVMARFCRAHGVSLAPHAKTTMSPQLIARQLAAGAWGVTAASPAQARLFRGFGVGRIVIANQVVDPRGLEWLAADPAGVCCLVDSEQGVELMDDGLAGRGPVAVLVEMGLAGGPCALRASSASRASSRSPASGWTACCAR